MDAFHYYILNKIPVTVFPLESVTTTICAVAVIVWVTRFPLASKQVDCNMNITYILKKSNTSDFCILWHLDGSYL